MSEYLDGVKRYAANANEKVVAGIVKHLGIALKSKDASLVSCSSKDELERVRESWCKKKLGLAMSDADLDKGIQEICEKMKADQRKHRVTFYYLLAENTASSTRWRKPTVADRDQETPVGRVVRGSFSCNEA